MSNDTSLGVQPYTGSGNSKIRNLSLKVIDDTTGTENTVLMQVVSIADKSGQILSLHDIEWQAEVLEELRAIRRGIGELIGNPFLREGD